MKSGGWFVSKSLSTAASAWACGLMLLAGCSSTPTRVEMVEIDPDDAAAQAMAAYDANKDGRLADDELRAVPGILKWKQLYDTDGDGAVSQAEIVARIEKWQSDQLAFCSVSANVKLNGKPVKGVEVTLVPEAYLGPGLKRAKGVTNRRGNAVLTVASEDLPEAIKVRGISAMGAYTGTYRIELKHASINLPNVSRDGLQLGEEVARDTIDTTFRLDLATK
ncbi:MAG: hypothetical protein AB7G28_20925 [Pirellulales bacterium]